MIMVIGERIGILAADPPATDPDAIKEIQVVATYLGGTATFEA